MRSDNHATPTWKDKISMLERHAHKSSNHLRATFSQLFLPPRPIPDREIAWAIISLDTIQVQVFLPYPAIELVLQHLGSTVYQLQ